MLRETSPLIVDLDDDRGRRDPVVMTYRCSIQRNSAVGTEETRQPHASPELTQRRCLCIPCSPVTALTASMGPMR